MTLYFDDLQVCGTAGIPSLYSTMERQDLFVTPFDETIDTCKIGERVIGTNGCKYGRILVVSRKQLESLYKQIASILETNTPLRYKDYMEGV